MRKNKLLLLLVLLMTAATGAWAQSALTGAFTINADGDQVQFSSGNLQATYNGTAWSWAFATNQWDIIGNEAANTSINGDGTISGTGTVDLFGWVGVNSAFTGTAIYGITNSTTANQYGNTKDEALKSDWGNTIGAGWYTLTIDEWTYVLNTRTTTSGVRYAKATVNGIEGLILLPDDWSTGYYSLASTNTTDAAFTSNEISSTDWTNSLEAHGAVFLPACGYRNGTTVTISSPNQGFYWSSTSSSSNALQARRLNFNNIGLNLSSGTVRTRGHSVRLVKAAEASPGGSGSTTALNVKQFTPPTEWRIPSNDLTTFTASDMPSDFTELTADEAKTWTPTAEQKGTGGALLLYKFDGPDACFVTYGEDVALMSGTFLRYMITSFSLDDGAKIYYIGSDGGSGSEESSTYKVSMKEGTEDAANWTGKAGDGDYQALPLTGVAKGAALTLKYDGTKKVKSVKAVKKAEAPHLVIEDKNNYFGIGNQKFYFTEGETWTEAMANHPENAAAGWIIYNDRLRFKPDVYGYAIFILRSGDYNIIEDTILNQPIDTSKTYMFEGTNPT